MNRKCYIFIKTFKINEHPDFLEKVLRSRCLHRSWVSLPKNKEELKTYTQRSKKTNHEGFAVCLKETNEIIGIININEIVRGAFQSGYIGYYVFVPFDGKGYMKSALKLVIKQAFTTLKLHRLEANIQPDNIASISLVKACGFEKEGYSKKYLKIRGRWRDHERWAIVK